MNEMNRNILLVEDEEGDIELITNAMKKFNLINVIDVARDGEQALKHAEQLVHVFHVETDAIVAHEDHRLFATVVR